MASKIKAINFRIFYKILHKWLVLKARPKYDHKENVKLGSPWKIKLEDENCFPKKLKHDASLVEK